MAKQIKWTKTAQQDRTEIFDYWNNRNKSNVYSKKLNRLFIENINLLSLHPKLGREYGKENIRLSVVKDYLIVYQDLEEYILILTIWDTRQNPQKLSLKL